MHLKFRCCSCFKTEVLKRIYSLNFQGCFTVQLSMFFAFKRLSRSQRRFISYHIFRCLSTYFFKLFSFSYSFFSKVLNKKNLKLFAIFLNCLNFSNNSLLTWTSIADSLPYVNTKFDGIKCNIQYAYRQVTLSSFQSPAYRVNAFLLLFAKSTFKRFKFKTSILHWIFIMIHHYFKYTFRHRSSKNFNPLWGIYSFYPRIFQNIIYQC